MKLPLNWILVSLIMGLSVGCASTAPPTETSDGLVLQPDTRFQEVYARPGVDVSGFSEFGLESCEVSFRRNWQREQNENRVDLSNRVTQQDVDRIKDQLGALCDEHFLAALQKPPAYPMTDAFDEGEAVLVLRPSIINLDIAAPDIRSPGRSRSYTTEAGEMTLSMDIVDATTGETLYRIVDRRRSRDTGRMEWTTGVSNRAEAGRMLTRWSDLLREGLDRVTGR